MSQDENPDLFTGSDSFDRSSWTRVVIVARQNPKAPRRMPDPDLRTLGGGPRPGESPRRIA
jgi:hypothetical protein